MKNEIITRILQGKIQNKRHTDSKRMRVTQPCLSQPSSIVDDNKALDDSTKHGGISIGIKENLCRKRMSSAQLDLVVAKKEHELGPDRTQPTHSSLSVKLK